MDEKKPKALLEQIITDITMKTCRLDPMVADFSRPIRISGGRSELVIDIFIIVCFGCRIPDTAWNLQEAVQKAVSSQADCTVKKVNITISGVIDKDGSK